MLQVSFINENREKVLEGLKKRYFSNTGLIEKILKINNLRKDIQLKYDGYLADYKRLSREIGHLLKLGEKEKSQILCQESINFKKKIDQLHVQLSEVQHDISNYLLEIPNIPHDLVKLGFSSENNEIIEQNGACPSIQETHLSHWELAKKFHLINWKLGTQISGSGFPIYIGKGARFQRALIDYFLHWNTQAGYIEYSLPCLVNSHSVYGTGQLPDKDAQMYHIKKDDLYLIPTGEVPLMNCFRDKIFHESQMPLKATTYTPCFRRESGSYGAKVRGLNRLHQFDKVEIIQLTTPEKSYEALDDMVSHIKGILKTLHLPFRISRLCGGETGFTSAMTYDFEVYSVAQDRWLEVSSVSNCTDFQTYRLKLRYKNKSGHLHFCHALNGSSLAVPRILSSLLEHYQSKNTIIIPPPLIPFTGFEKITLPIDAL